MSIDHYIEDGTEEDAPQRRLPERTPDGREWIPSERRWETSEEARSRRVTRASLERHGYVDLDEWMRGTGRMF